MTPNLRIDGLQYSKWNRERLEELRRGGLTAVHVTLAIWEGARETLDLVGRWNQLIRDNSDILCPGTSGGDIEAAKRDEKTAIIFGFQNASPFEDDVALVEVFYQLGVRVVQLTYNIQNHVGGSCYENDSGLTRFGANVVSEMNRLGMIVDLSHVGNRTTLDAIEASSRPVAITHANPSWHLEHPRNKPDDVLRALADNGGVLGCAPYPHLAGDDTGLEQWCQMVVRTAEQLGVDHVGIGSDSSFGWDDEFLMWIRMGRWTHTPDYGAGTPSAPGWAQWPDWFQSPADFPLLEEGLGGVGLTDAEVAKIIGGNWFRLFAAGFEPAH